MYSTRAHVFQIDPTTKKSWLPCSKQAVTVSFYYDPNKETHRIISVDGPKVRVKRISQDGRLQAVIKVQPYSLRNLLKHKCIVICILANPKVLFLSAFLTNAYNCGQTALYIVLWRNFWRGSFRAEIVLYFPVIMMFWWLQAKTEVLYYNNLLSAGGNYLYFWTKSVL